MWWVIIIGFVVAVLSIGFIRSNKEFKQQKRIKQELAEKHGITMAVFGTYVEGNNINIGFKSDDFAIAIARDKLVMQGPKTTYTVPIERVNYAVEGPLEVVLEKSKSVVGRAVVGTVLFGALGGVVGGMSGTGTRKETKKVGHSIGLGWTNKEGNNAIVTFRTIDSYNARKLVSEIKAIVQGMGVESVEL